MGNLESAERGKFTVALESELNHFGISQTKRLKDEDM